MSQYINVQVTMPDNQVYKIKIDKQATVQDVLDMLLVANKEIIKNKYANGGLFLFFELEQAEYFEGNVRQFSSVEPLHQLIDPKDFAKTEIQNLIQKDKSILKLKFKIPDESTKIFSHKDDTNSIDKNLIKLNDIMSPERRKFEKITDDVSLLKFCQEKNKQKVKSYADYSDAQKIVFWKTIEKNILDVENKKFSLETVFEFHIFVFGNEKINNEDFSNELYGISDGDHSGIFLYSEYLDIQGYEEKDSEDKIKSMKPIFDFINQHKKKYEDRDNVLNYINLIDFFCDMCDEKFTWQDILDLKLINFENADDFQKLDHDGLGPIINILEHCLSKNSNDQGAITAIKNIFANVPNGVARIDQIVQLLSLCKKNDIDIKMNENTLTKLFKKINDEEYQLTTENLLLIFSFCEDSSIPEDIMKNMMARCKSYDLLIPTTINYIKSKTKFNIGFDFNSGHSFAVYNIGSVCEAYEINVKNGALYTKDNFIELFSFINRERICNNFFGIGDYQSYRKEKKFGNMESCARDIFNAKNTLNESKNEMISDNKLTLAELHVIFFSDFNFDNQSYNLTEQQFKNMIPDEIDFGYLKFLLLFYSEQNALTSENIIFCFEKYRVGIDESLDNLFKYLDYNYIKVQNGDDDSSYRPKKYIKMSDADKNVLICKLFDIYIKNCKIKVRSDDFNKAKEARNKYLTKEYLKTITEKENQQTVIDSNKNEVSNNEIKNTNSNDSSSIIILKIIGHVFTLGIFIWIPFLFNIIFGDCSSCIKTGITNKDNILISSVKNKRYNLKNKDKAEDKIGMEDNNLDLN